MDLSEARAAYVALALTPGIGARRLAALLNRFDSALGALSAPFEFLCTVPGISRAAATAIAHSSRADGLRVLEAATSLGATVLLPGDPDFPTGLTDCPDPPTILFAQGDLALLNAPAVAIVGSRDHSEYGAEVCERVAGAAARAGIAVVSGMARGLDAIAHTAALDAPGPTIGILGNGLGVIYPAANRELYQRVEEHGLLLTEFPPGERPGVGSFPRRNRLISALAKVTVVIEAAEASGTLITVGTALEQGRDVMAVPGMITSPTSIGTNRLIRDGAEPLLSVDDLLRHYGLEPTAEVVVPEAERSRRPSTRAARPVPKAPEPMVAEPVPIPADLPAAEDRVARLLQEAPLGVDAIMRRSGLPAAAVLVAISALELRGLARQEGGRVAWTLKGGGDVLN